MGMNEPPAPPLRFLGVTGAQLGKPFGYFDIGEVVTVDYAGVSYQARIITRNADYDDFGTEVMRYDLEVTGTTPSP